MMVATVHIIGAGLAGLSAAARLAAMGERVAVYEATGQAGGRCRSYHDPALDMMIDNGNHLVLSGNRAALGYLDLIGARDGLVGPGNAHFPFVDVGSGEDHLVEEPAVLMHFQVDLAQRGAQRSTAHAVGNYVHGPSAALFDDLQEKLDNAPDAHHRIYHPGRQRLSFAAGAIAKIRKAGI